MILVLFGHWVFDFVAQSDWMALNKSRSWRALGAHIWVITLGCASVGVALGGSWRGVVAWAAVNGGAHFVIDAVTSRITARLWVAEKRHEFFVVIGFDQFLHVTLALATLGLVR